MALASGKRIGSYEIVELIGSGGMGEVYRATDTKLGRDVAIKTLPAALADDKDRLARFEREARLLASLNHAHIAAVHSLDESDGTLNIVMELVEGESLEQRLTSGSIPLEDALEYGLQIASALEAAHGKGVVHRDLKPANIMITPDGVIKLLDFGLAKAFAGKPAEASPAHSPTLSVAMTQAGLVLGTAGYMSPEQASGQAADQRADIWAFGVVLFEMLTGIPLFSGESVPHILAEVLKTEPDWGKLPKNLHPRLRLLLERCLTKKPRNRYHSIAEARVDIECVLSDPRGIAPEPAPAAIARRGRAGLLLGGIAVLLAVILGGASVWFLTPEPVAQTSRWELLLPEGESFSTFSRGPLLAISPDGGQIVYNTMRGLWLRSIGEREARLIAGTDDQIFGATFSPDGESLAFWSESDRQIQRIATVGGTAVNLVAAQSNPTPMSWETEGTILYTMPEGVMRVSENGGEPELVVPVTGATSPQLLPNGNAILYNTATEVGVYSLVSGESEVLFPGRSPRYIPTGHIVYADGPVLSAVPFDADRLEVTGRPVPLVDDLALDPISAHYDVSDSGSLVSIAASTLASPEANGVLEWVYLDGSREPLPLEARPYRHPKISPDGARLAVQTTDRNGESDIWVYELDGSAQIRQMTGEGNNSRPLWTPDGQRLTFVSDRNGIENIYWQDAGLGSRAEPLTPLESGPQVVIPEAWLPDGNALLFTKASRGTGFNIWIMELGADPEVIIGDPSGSESSAALSPNGKWVAYSKFQNGDPENRQLYIQPYPPDGDTSEQVLTRQGGSVPHWSPDGTELFYFRGTPGQEPRNSGQAGVAQEFVKIGITLDGAPRVTAEQRLPIRGFQYFAGTRDYDMHPDGNRFIMIFPEQQTSSAGSARSRIDVVLNWFEEVEQRVPAD